MARYKVILAYDGTDFLGFQRQARHPKARTVQGVVEHALERIGWQGRAILAAGRTDTGVHAAGQVIAFDLEWSHSAETLQAALNANLPPAVAVQAVSPTRPDFHPRFDALARRYQYRIFCAPARDPLRERYAWRVWPAVELERLEQAAAYIPGQHDFVAFGSPPRTAGPTTREVFQARWLNEPPGWPVDAPGGLLFEIKANAFLYHMVRRLVSYQVKIGQGLIEPEALAVCLHSPAKSQVKGLAPAHGLTLVEVTYPAAENNPAVQQV